MELRLKESEEKVSDLDARASIAKQRIAILERELETSRDMQKDLQSELAAARAQAAADRQQLQVRGKDTSDPENDPHDVPTLHNTASALQYCIMVCQPCLTRFALLRKV